MTGWHSPRMLAAGYSGSPLFVVLVDFLVQPWELPYLTNSLRADDVPPVHCWGNDTNGASSARGLAAVGNYRIILDRSAGVRSAVARREDVSWHSDAWSLTLRMFVESYRGRISVQPPAFSPEPWLYRGLLI